MTTDRDRVPLTLHFPAGWRRKLFIKVLAITGWLLGARIERHDD